MQLMRVIAKCSLTNIKTQSIRKDILGICKQIENKSRELLSPKV